MIFIFLEYKWDDFARNYDIQSNIPLIVLALSVICVVVIGFLELKNDHKINELTIEVQNRKK